MKKKKSKVKFRNGKRSRKRSYKKKISIYSCLSFLCLLLCGWINSNFFKNDYLEVYFIDVGQGDSEYIKTPNNKSIIIDGGNRGKGENVVRPFLHEKGVKDVECAMVTHFHDDHVFGVEEIMPYFNISNLLIPKCRNDNYIHNNLVKIAKKNGCSVHHVLTDDKIKIDSAIDFSILYAGENSNGSENDNSIVSKLGYGKTSFLFTGDIEKNVENALLSQKDIRSTVLKSAHHGSNTSNTFPFIKLVCPTYVVIEVGKNNKYHHPHDSVINTFSKLGVNVLRTDLNSTIKFVVDKERILKVVPLRN